jgi:hypothetical protein
MQGFVEAKRVADPDQADARRPAEIGQHLSYELMQFRVIDH